MNHRFMSSLPSRVRQKMERVEYLNRHKVLTAGTVITCPSCEARIAVALEDIPFAHSLGVEKFEVFQGHNGEDAPVCKKCQTAFFDAKGRVHTAEGWR